MAGTDTISQSRDIILGSGTVVHHADYGIGILDYEGWTQEDGDYAFVVFYKETSIKVPLASIKPISIWRWQLWRDPRGGFRRHRHGGNWAVLAMFAYAFYIWAIIDNAREFSATHDYWHFGVVAFCALMICCFQFFNWRNWYNMVDRHGRHDPTPPDEAQKIILEGLSGGIIGYLQGRMIGVGKRIDHLKWWLALVVVCLTLLIVALRSWAALPLSFGMAAMYSLSFRYWLNRTRGLVWYYLGPSPSYLYRIDIIRNGLIRTILEQWKKEPERSKYDLVIQVVALRYQWAPHWVALTVELVVGIVGYLTAIWIYLKG